MLYLRNQMKAIWITLFASTAIVAAAPKDYAPIIPKARLFPLHIVKPISDWWNGAYAKEMETMSKYAIPDGQATIELSVSCVSGEWILGIQRGTVKYTPFKYAEYHGPGGGAIIETLTGDLNNDGFNDVIMVQCNGGLCGLGAACTDNLLLLSDGFGGFRLWQFETYYFSANDFAALSAKAKCSVMLTRHLQADAPDGKTHSYWVFAPYEINGSSLIPLKNDLWPMWIWYKIKPNHEPTTHLTAAQKEKLWNIYIKEYEFIHEIVLKRADTTKFPSPRADTHR